MKKLGLFSTTAAMLLLGVCAASAQGMKTNRATDAPQAAQQDAPAVAPVVKSGQSKNFERAGQAAPIAPRADVLQTNDKGASAGVATKDMSAAAGRADAKPTRTAHNVHRRHFAGRYEGNRGPIYDRYGGHRGDYGCRGYDHIWILGPWC